MHCKNRNSELVRAVQNAMTQDQTYWVQQQKLNDEKNVIEAEDAIMHTTCVVE